MVTMVNRRSRLSLPRSEWRNQLRGQRLGFTRRLSRSLRSSADLEPGLGEEKSSANHMGPLGPHLGRLRNTHTHEFHVFKLLCPGRRHCKRVRSLCFQRAHMHAFQVAGWDRGCDEIVVCDGDRSGALSAQCRRVSFRLPGPGFGRLARQPLRRLSAAWSRM